jgi:hypothetical protein
MEKKILRARCLDVPKTTATHCLARTLHVASGKSTSEGVSISLPSKKISICDSIF